MSRLITAADRIKKARALIEEARQLPRPADAGWENFSYTARVKDLLRQARDLVKFIPNSAGATPEIKSEATAVIAESEQAEREILHPS